MLPKLIYATVFAFCLSNHERQLLVSGLDAGCDDGVGGAKHRSFGSLDLRSVATMGFSSSTEFAITAVARGSKSPILCSMREGAESKSPETIPSGKSLTRIADNPGMKSRVWSSCPATLQFVLLWLLR